MAGLVIRGASPIERVREDIRVSASDEGVLRKSLHPLDVRRIVQFRQAIAYEFEKMLANAGQVALRRRRMSDPGRNCPQLPENQNELTHAF